MIEDASDDPAGRTIRLVYRKDYPCKALEEKLADVIAGIEPNTVKPARR